MTKSTFSLERAASLVLLVLTCLVPFFFVPALSFSIDMSKTLLLVLGVFIAFSAYLIAAVKKGEIALPSTRVLWAVLLIPLAFLVSALLSGSAHISLFGYGLEVGTWAFVTLGFVLMYLVACVSHTREKVFYSYLGLLAAFVIVAGLAIIKIFFGAGSFGGVLSGNVFSPVGSLSDVAVFFGAAIVLLIMALEELPSRPRTKWLLGLGLIVSLFIVALSSVSTVWIGLLVFAFIYLLYAFSRSNADLPETVERKVSYSALFVLLVSLLFVWNPTVSSSGAHLSEALAGKWNITNLSVSPSLSATYQVSRPVLKDSLLLGSGPNTFDTDWLLYKPLAVNSTIFWNAPFTYGIGLLTTFLATTGVVGALLWALFIIFFTLLGMRAIFSRGTDLVGHFLVSSAFAASLFLWIVFLFYVPSKAIFALAFILSGLFIGGARALGVVATKTIIFRNSSKLAFVAVLLLVAMLVGNVAYGYMAVKQSVASYYYNKASIAAGQGDIEAARTDAVRAANLAPEDIYLSAVAQIGVARANAILTSTSTDQNTARTNFQNALSETIAAAQAATQARPDNYANWITLGQLYESLVPAPLSVAGAYDSAKSAYTEAQKHNPESPEPYYYLARLEVENKNSAGARDLIKQALLKKNDYADAYYLLTQIEIADGNTDEAIKNAQTLTLLQPTNSGVFFQLGLLEYNKGDYQDAAAALAEALQISPDYANAKYYDALSLDKLGQHDQALALLSDLLKSNPDNTELPQIIANIKAGKDALYKIGSSSTTPPISGAQTSQTPSSTR